MNYQGCWRTNAFRVKDLAAFLAWIERFDIEIDVIGVEQDTEHFIYLLCEEGSIPTAYGDDEEPAEIDFATELAMNLVTGEVAIIMEAGYEGMRYVNGFAVAVNSAGESRQIDLSDIYKLAHELGPAVREAALLGLMTALLA
jgi:hypothetical protein